jgi:hypothetical protein
LRNLSIDILKKHTSDIQEEQIKHIKQHTTASIVYERRKEKTEAKPLRGEAHYLCPISQLGRCLPQAVRAYSGTRRGCPQRSLFAGHFVCHT